MKNRISKKYMTIEVKCCTLFSYVSFYLKVSHTRFLMRSNAINEYDVLFSPRTVFPIGFSNGVFNEACDNCPRGSVVKHTNLILEGKEKVES